MDNPAGYLYRVAVSAARRHQRWRRPVRLPPERTADEGTLGPDLADALARLRPHQRTCVVLAHVYGWSHAEIAELTGLTVHSVRNHLHRGLRRLRQLIEPGGPT